MDGSRMSDFSIERILSPQLGHRPPAMHYLPEHQGLPAVYGLDSRCLRPPAPVPVGLLPYGVMSFAERFYPCSAGFHPADFTGVYPNSGVCVHISSQEPTDVKQLAHYQLPTRYHPTGLPQVRQKARIRTVFTDSQTQQLEALFEQTDYPAVEARAEVARVTGLSEETVRVWFKNRRARRKRQHSDSKVKSQSPPPSTGAERKVFTSVL